MVPLAIRLALQEDPGPMDIRTLTLVNMIFLFLYAGIMLLNTSIYGEVRGSKWFAWSNLTRGIAVFLLTVCAALPRFFSVIIGDMLLVIGLMLLHRSLAEVLGRGKTAWNLQFGLAVAVLFGISYSTYVLGGHTDTLMLVSGVLAVQMALTSALLFSNLNRGIRLGAWLTGGILFAYAVVYMMRAIALYRYPDGGASQISSTMLVALLVGSLLANGATAFGFMFLSAAQLRLELTRQAERDSLTGLLNRRGLKTLADRSLCKSHRAGEPLSAVMLDLDGMKVANDTWGHECGDALLCAVAGLLVESVGKRGAVARLGGDEFLVVLPGMAEGGAMEIAEQLRSAIERLHIPRCHPRASFGVASMTGVSWEEAVRLSDKALYRAKNAGRNRVMCFG
jgi:diguanylate cyclase (GGDEF)-like protein